jgi:hypothetical protein
MIFQNKRKREAIKKDMANYRDFIIKENGEGSLNPAEFEHYMASEDGQKELFTIVFGKLARKWWREGKVYSDSTISERSNNIFKRMFDALKKIWNLLSRKPLRLDDIFEGEYQAGAAALKDIVNSGIAERNDRINAAKQKTLNDNYRENADADLLSDKDAFLKSQEMIEEDMNLDPDDVVGRDGMNKYIRNIVSKRALGRGLKPLKWLYTTQSNKERMAHQKSEKYSGIIKPFTSHPSRRERDAIFTLAVNMKKLGKKSIDNGDGTITVIDENSRQVRLTPEQSRAYLSLQQGFREVLNDLEIQYRVDTSMAFDLEQNYTRQDIVDLLEATDKKNKYVRNSLKNIIKTLDNFSNIKSSDFAPLVRFGDGGINILKNIEGLDLNNITEEQYQALRAKENQAWFGTVERYSNKHSKRWHPLQQETRKQQIRQKGFDNADEYLINPKFEKTGRTDADGNPIYKATVQTLDNLRPFRMSKDDNRDRLPVDFISVDILMGLLSSTRLHHDGKAVKDASEDISKNIFGHLSKEEMDALADQLKDQLDVQAKQAVFNKALDFGSSNVEGYSLDTDRVVRSYFHSAARSGAYMHYRKAVENIRANTLKNYNNANDDTLEYIDKYADYVNDPTEDWQAVRAGNFVWTMGLAPVSAILQYMNLLTTTPAQMQQYNPRTLDNLARIGKHLKLASKFTKWENIEWRDNAPVVRWDNEEIWRKEIRPMLRDLDQDQFNQFKEGFINAFRSGIVGAALVEESAQPSLSGELTGKEKVKQATAKAIQFSGFFIGIAEQQSRAATHGAMLELMLTNPTARMKARKVLMLEGATEEEKRKRKADPVFDAFYKTNPNLSFEQAVAQFSLEESHAVFGKTARPDIFKTWGGSVALPFMTWPQQMWENMHNMALNRGSEGKAGLAMMFGMMFLIGGFVGMPGVEFLKELYEHLYKTLTLEEIDLVEKLHGSTDSRLVGEFASHGFLRSILGVDLAQRTSIPVIGEKILLFLMGAVDDPTVALGVAGSLANSLATGVDNFRSGASMWRVAPEMMPIALKNITKAVSYTTDGVVTGRGTQLIPPEDVTFADVALRAVGATSAHVSRNREEQWFAQVLNREDKTKYTTIKKRLVNAKVAQIQAQRRGNEKAAKKAQRKFDKAMGDLRSFVKEEKYPISPLDLMNAMQDEIAQRLTGNVRFDRLSKSAQMGVATSTWYNR